MEETKKLNLESLEKLNNMKKEMQFKIDYMIVYNSVKKEELAEQKNKIKEYEEKHKLQQEIIEQLLKEKENILKSNDLNLGTSSQAEPLRTTLDYFENQNEIREQRFKLELDSHVNQANKFQELYNNLPQVQKIKKVQEEIDQMACSATELLQIARNKTIAYNEFLKTQEAEAWTSMVRMVENVSKYHKFKKICEENEQKLKDLPKKLAKIETEKKELMAVAYTKLKNDKSQHSQPLTCIDLTQSDDEYNTYLTPPITPETGEINKFRTPINPVLQRKSLSGHTNECKLVRNMYFEPSTSKEFVQKKMKVDHSTPITKLTDSVTITRTSSLIVMSTSTASEKITKKWHGKN